MIGFHGVHGVCGVTRCEWSSKCDCQRVGCIVSGTGKLSTKQGCYTSHYRISALRMEDNSIQHIYKLLENHPGLPEAIDMDKVIRFIRLTASLKWSIIHAQKPGYNPKHPSKLLPDGMHNFLGSALGLALEFVQGCWDAFNQTIWNYDHTNHSSAADAKTFHIHSKEHNLGTLIFLY